MKMRWTVLGVAIGFGLALMLGFAFVSDGSGAALDPTDRWADMEAMHDSSAMQELHAQMPEELQAQCEAMHEQMGQMVGGMMGGDMAAHHSQMTGGGMIGPGSRGGGMMGPGSNGMMGG